MWTTLFLILGLCSSLAVPTVPPTLPHAHHHAIPNPVHLDLNTVRSVLDSIEKMWHDYTMLTNHTAEVEAHLASVTEKLTSSEKVCDVEKHALEQVHLVRVNSLERRLNVTKINNCTCALSECNNDVDKVKSFTITLFEKLENIWNTEGTEESVLNDKSVRTKQVLNQARNDFDALKTDIKCDEEVQQDTTTAAA